MFNHFPVNYFPEVILCSLFKDKGMCKWTLKDTIHLRGLVQVVTGHKFSVLHLSFYRWSGHTNCSLCLKYWAWISHYIPSKQCVQVGMWRCVLHAFSFTSVQWSEAPSAHPDWRHPHHFPCEARGCWEIHLQPQQQSGHLPLCLCLPDSTVWVQFSVPVLHFSLKSIICPNKNKSGILILTSCFFSSSSGIMFQFASPNGIIQYKWQKMQQHP